MRRTSVTRDQMEYQRIIEYFHKKIERLLLGKILEIRLRPKVALVFGA